MPANCKVETALEILVGKWKPVILFHLISNGTMRFKKTPASRNIESKWEMNRLKQLANTEIAGVAVISAIFAKADVSAATQELLHLSREIIHQ